MEHCYCDSGMLCSALMLLCAAGWQIVKVERYYPDRGWLIWMKEAAQVPAS